MDAQVPLGGIAERAEEWRVAPASRNGDTAAAQLLAEQPRGDGTCLHLGRRSQVRLIILHPGGALELQQHHHRAEHWIIIEGTARVMRGSEEMVLSEAQSVFIPIGTSHRLENPGRIPLHLIEVQYGSYLGDDDVVRLDAL